MVDVTLLCLIYRQFYDLLEIFKIGGYCPDTNYLFLGTLELLPTLSFCVSFFWLRFISGWL